MRTAEQLMREVEGLGHDLSAALLGFTIMQQMVEAHLGTIAHESAEGKGTKVTENLPVDRAVFENNPNIQFTDPEELPDVAEPASAEEPSKQEVIIEDTEVKQDQQLPLFTEETPEEAAPSAVGGNKKTILIVEDH